jgi:hypothetical protein
MSDETDNPNNTPSADELRETIRAEVRAELKAELAKNETALNAIITEEIAAAPEHVKKLIPESVAPVEKLKWIRAAKEAGLFAAPNVATTDNRRPANTKPTTDTASLSPIARIASGYNSK